MHLAETHINPSSTPGIPFRNFHSRILQLWFQKVQAYLPTSTLAQRGPGWGPKPAEPACCQPADGIWPHQLDASLPAKSPFLLSEDMDSGPLGHHVEVEVWLHHHQRPDSIWDSRGLGHEELLLISLHPAGALPSAPNALVRLLPPGQTRIPPLPPNRHITQRGEQKSSRP